MKTTLVCAGAVALGLFVGSLRADTLITENYNFQLPGGGGGATALLNGDPVEIFCDDFADEVFVPSNNTANVTTLGTSANLDNTRFGKVTQWTNISGTTNDSFFNSGAGRADLARYTMVAYLVSQYDVSAGANPTNDAIQYAIWTLMDPQGESIGIGGYPSPNGELNAAYTWYTALYSNLSTHQQNIFLNRFEVVSDPTMSSTVNADGLRTGGFQEQIVETPEPRSLAVVIGLLALGLFVRRKLAPASA